MAQERPLNDVSGFVGEGRAMPRGQLVELQIKCLIRPIGRKAEQEACYVEHWDRYTEHHNYPNHRDDLRIPVVELNDRPRVKILIVLLHYLLRLLPVFRAASVQALQSILDDPLTNGSDRSEPIDESSCENCDANDTVPLSGEVAVVTVEKDTVESDSVQNGHDETVFAEVVIDEDQQDGCVEKLKDPHL